MEYEQIIAVAKAVSELGMTSFEYKEDNLSISMHFPGKECGGQIITSTPAIVQTSAGAQPQTEMNQSVVRESVVSPLVGTFYASPTEDGDPFVKVGDHVKQGQILCIVEAMKLMNEIESDKEGVIKEIFVKNGEPVEYGQMLFAIEEV